MKKVSRTPHPTRGLSAFQDSRGRISGWPSARRRDMQIAVLEALAVHFEGGRSYSEGEVNNLLKVHSTLEDFALLRRELVEGDYLARTPDGSAYWRADGRPIPTTALTGEPRG